MENFEQKSDIFCTPFKKDLLWLLGGKKDEKGTNMKAERPSNMLLQ